MLAAIDSDAAGRVDQAGAARQLGEERGIEDAAGRLGERQEADQDLAAGQESVEPVVAMIAGDPVHALR